MFQNPESSSRILRVKNIDTNSFVPFSLNYTESSYLDEISEENASWKLKCAGFGWLFSSLGRCFDAQSAYNWDDSLILSASTSQVTKWGHQAHREIPMSRTDSFLFLVCCPHYQEIRIVTFLPYASGD